MRMFVAYAIVLVWMTPCVASGFAPRIRNPSWKHQHDLLPKKTTKPSFPAALVRRSGSSSLPAAADVSIQDDVQRETETVKLAVTSTPPSWDELSKALILEQEQSSSSTAIQKPLVTLFRDTNGWCPFCERVWLALRVKGIPYQTTLVSLQNKPEWYKQLVPTTLVPAILIHEDILLQDVDDDDSHNELKTKERRLVWESTDILRALDEAFPNTDPLMVGHEDTPAFQQALELNDQLSSAGFAYIYAGRNNNSTSPLTDGEVANRRVAFEEQLDKLEAALAESSAEGGPTFRLGATFTAMDIIMIPTLERWRYQLPVTVEMDIMEGRPHLQRWFQAMDAFAPYAHRVAGDEYSWTATASMFLRYFGGGENKPEVASAIERADQAAQDLSRSFAHSAAAAAVSAGTNMNENNDEPTFASQAAAKLISSHEAVVNDCTRGQDPLSQKHIPRASNKDVADVVLRYVTSILLAFNDNGNVLESARSAPLVEVSDASEGALAARTVACRLCAPRDMGAPAASILRAVLAIVADRLDDESSRSAT